MKKQIKQLTVMAVLLFVLAGLLLFSRKTGVFKEKEEETLTYYLVDIPTDSVDGLSYYIDNTEIMITKDEDGNWNVESDPDIDLDEDAVNSMVNVAASVSSEDVLESPEDLSEYGLDEPQNTITVYKNDGSYMTYKIGAKETMSGKYYAMTPEDGRVYLVATKYLSNVVKEIEDITYVPEEVTETS